MATVTVAIQTMVFASHADPDGGEPDARTSVVPTAHEEAVAMHGNVGRMMVTVNMDA